MELQISHFPRINREACLYCFDDCIATIADTMHFDYELMYLTLFQIDFIYDREESRRLGDNIRLNFPDRYENMRKYHGVQFHDTDVRKIPQEAVSLLEKAIGDGMPALVYVDPYWCPWDLQYKKVHERFSGHTLIVRDITERGISMADPYFNRTEIWMPYDHFVKGILNVVTIHVERREPLSDAQLYEGLSDSLLDVKKRGTLDDLIQLYRNFCACEDIHNEVRGEDLYLYSPVFVHFMLINQGICYYAAALRRMADYLGEKDEKLKCLGDELWEVGHKWNNFRYEMKVNFFSNRKSEKKKAALDEKMKWAVYKIQEIFFSLFEHYLNEI